MKDNLLTCYDWLGIKALLGSPNRTSLLEIQLLNFPDELTHIPLPTVTVHKWKISSLLQPMQSTSKKSQ